MTVIAPPELPQPQVQQEDLEALIEEARRRARRRRLTYLAAVIFALVIGAAVWAALALTGGGQTAAGTAPPGFQLVQAKGPVAHAVLDYRGTGWSVVDIRSGRQRPAKVTEELWYDSKSRLFRDLFRVDGRIRIDLAGRACARPCASEQPLSYLQPFPWPPSKLGYHEAGHGTFEGHDVLWVQPIGLSNLPKNETAPQYGLDPGTHRTLVARWVAGGRLTGAVTTVEQRPDVAGGTEFVVPQDPGVVQYPPAFFAWPDRPALRLGYGFSPARKTLGTAPLWLGPRFRKYDLRSVSSARYGLDTANGKKLLPWKSVSFYYGAPDPKDAALTVEEFAKAPYFFKQVPHAGLLERDGVSVVWLSRRGILLRITSDPHAPLTRATALAVARALRPLPARLRTLPTLHEQ